MRLVDAVLYPCNKGKHRIVRFQPAGAHIASLPFKKRKVEIDYVLRLPDGALPLLDASQNEVRRVASLGKPRHFYVHAKRERELGTASRRKHARAVGIKCKHDVLREPVEKY